MQRKNRSLLVLLLAATLALPSSVIARDVFPSKPVKIIVGFPAGSATDVAARVLAQRLGQTLGQQFIVDNGANFLTKTYKFKQPVNLSKFDIYKQ